MVSKVSKIKHTLHMYCKEDCSSIWEELKTLLVKLKMHSGNFKDYYPSRGLVLEQDHLMYNPTGSGEECKTPEEFLNKIKVHYGHKIKAVPAQLGAKYDGGKLNFRAFTRGLAKPIKAISAVLTYGCEKYAEDSWQQVPNGKARYESALDRHMNAWTDGEKYDEESGLPHLAHAACNMMFVLWFELTDGSLDDKDYTTYNKPPVRG